MRVAILSSLKRTNDAGANNSGDEYYAALLAGNRSVLDRQVDLAIAAGCERIACLADSLEQHIIDAQHRAERDGLKFTVVREKLALAGVVKAADTIVVIADGLVFPQALAPDLLSAKNCVVSLPAEPAIVAGFERIDRDKAWAGVLLSRGSLVEELSALPDDFGVEPSLLRLALQDGCPIVQADVALLNSGDLILADGPDDMRKWFERRLVRLLPTPDSYQPSTKVSDLLIRRLVSVGRSLRTRAATVLGAWIIMLAVAVMLALYVGPAIGIGILSLAALTYSIGIGLERLRFDDAKLPRSVQFLDRYGPYFADAAWIGLAILSVKAELMIPMGFAAVIWVGLQLLVRLLNPAPLLRFLTDRPLVYAVLAMAAFIGQLLLATQFLALVLLASLLFNIRKQN